MCKYSPLEIAAGFGVESERLEAVLDTFDTADALAHPNICGYGKALLEACADQAVREVLLVNCCDVARRIYDILQKRGDLDFLWILDLPHQQTRAAEWMFERDLNRFLDAYEAYSGIPFDYLRAWEQLAAQSRETYGKAQIQETFGGIAAGEGTGGSGKDGQAEEPLQPYISLQGAHGGPRMLRMLGEHFSIPVQDDTCSGNRRPGLIKKPADRAEFVHLYAKSLLQQPPCMRMNDVAGRVELGRGAAGIIYHTMKFCDYYGFEYAQKKNEHLPLLKIETDAGGQSMGQLATRLDAFAEQLHVQTGGNRKRSAAEKTVRPDEGNDTGGQARGRENGEDKHMSEGKYVAGIDSGSTSTDVVIMNREREIVSWSILRTGAGAASGAERALAKAIENAGCSRDEIASVIATGYGRTAIGLGDDAVTEITCHAKGAHYLKPETRTIIDIGGQDSKVIRIDADGNVTNFTMNDKCAAGTGRFLEMMARTLELSMEEMEKLGSEWKQDITISNMCTVFAESEVVSLIALNTPAPDIIHGLNKAVAKKTAALARRLGGEEGYMMTGGVAKNAGLVAELEKSLGVRIFVSEHAQLCGAIGAALIALEG
ncbi:MAG: 2-hydroxyacyl-CoA dehydratase [Eubacterium sp.]|nr:2-hydroxyacyl-CoA dehydratase [Eubacterium sp.]